MDIILLREFSEKEEVKALQSKLHQCFKPKEFIRLMAVLLSFLFKPEEVSKILSIGESSVYRYLDHYKVYPDCFHQRKPGSGRPEKEEQRELILQWLEDSPQAQGYPHSRWTCGLIQFHLSKQFAEPLSIECIRQILKKEGRLSWKRVKHGPPPTPDPKAEEKLARIEAVKASLKPDESLLYMDESDFNLLCPIRNEWSPVGEQKVVTTPGQNKKIYAFGAYDPENGKFIYSVRRRKRTREFIEFLYQILGSYSGKVYLIVDNWRVHFGKRAKAFCERHKDRIELLPLPTYSPQYNKIERLWGWAKDLTHCNYTCATVEELVRKAKSGLRMVQQALKEEKTASNAVSLSF